MEPVGYSGHGIGLNNPLMQTVKFVGPLPVGFYTMGEPINDLRVGEYAIPLIPDLENEMFGRGAFFMHGDEIKEPGAHNASDGCIIQALIIRRAAWSSQDHRLQVVASRNNGE